MTSSMDASGGDWRAQLPPESRQRIVNKITETLKRHLPISVPEGLNELRKIAVRFEEQIYTAATSQGDYLRKISLKMLSMESKTQQSVPINPAMSNPVAGNQNPTESGTSGLAPTLPSMSALTQSNISNVTQASNLQNMPGISQNNSIAQGGQTDIYATQRLMQGRQQLQQQQSQNPSIFQHQFQQQMMKQKMQQQASLMQPHIQQQQQQKQVTQAPLMQILSNQSNNIPQTQAATMQSNTQQLNQIQQTVPSLLLQNPQPAARQQQQQGGQQPMTISQQSNFSHQQMGQQGNIPTVSNMQQPHLLGQQNNISDLQQQQQSLPFQQNNILNIQQQHQQQQHMINQQQLNSQSNMSGLMQQLIGPLPNLQPHQRSMPMETNETQQQQQQQQQQTQPSSMAMLQPQGQQAQHQSPQQQQQLMPQFQNQSTQMQQQLLMQLQSNSMQREMQQRLQGSSNLLQAQNEFDQKPFIHSQRGLPEVSSTTSVESTAQNVPSGVVDWQEECYQKLKSMKEQYFTDISEFHQKIAFKLQQQEALGPQGKQPEQYERLKNFRQMLERMLSLLQITKTNIPVGLKEKLPMYEKQIMSMIASNRIKKMAPQAQTQQQQQFQHPIPNQQSSQASQLQFIDNNNNNTNQANPISLQGSGTSMQNISMALPTAHQSISNSSMQPTSNNIDSVQASSFNTMQQPSLQNSLSASQQNNMNTLSQNATSNTLQANVGIMQPDSNLLHQHVKQEHQQLLQTQQMKQQLAQCHIQLQQQILQQRRQVILIQKTQLPAHQVKQQLQTMNELNELKARQVSGNKYEYSASQRHNYYNQQLKPGPAYPASSPQNLQASSPQISRHSSPQIDKNGLLSSIPKANKAHIPSGNSPLVVTPSTPFAPSPIPVESEKPMSYISSFGHVGNQQTNAPQTQPHSIAVNMPGISASPLLEECTRLGGSQFHVPLLSDTSATERPMDQLIEAVQSLTPKALSSSVSDVGSVVCMIDRMAGSAPGNDSRTAVGEDLVAMTKCRLQACNFMSQDGGATSKKMNRHTSAVPLNNVTSARRVNDSFKQLHGFESSELESTATFHIKSLKPEIHHSLLEEIRPINQKLIDTVVDISDEDSDSIAASSEDGEGTVVKCFYTAFALLAFALLQYLVHYRLLYQFL